MVVWLNGRFVEEAEAVISPFDRGFLYGEGVFETIRCYKGTPFAFKSHMKRLYEGLAGLSIDVKTRSADLLRVAQELLRNNELGGTDAYLRITVTRGITDGLKDFETVNPSIFMHCKEIDAGLLSQKRRSGINVCSIAAQGRFMPQFKHLNYMPSVVALLKIAINSKTGKRKPSQRRAGPEYDEAVFVDDSNHILEGATSNIFFYNDATVVTPPAGKILPGIMRAQVIAALKNSGITVKEKAVRLTELNNYSGAFITNSIVELLPLRLLDKKRFSLKNFPRIYRMFLKQYFPDR